MKSFFILCFVAVAIVSSDAANIYQDEDMLRGFAESYMRKPSSDDANDITESEAAKVTYPIIDPVKDVSMMVKELANGMGNLAGLVADVANSQDEIVKSLKKAGVFTLAQSDYDSSYYEKLNALKMAKDEEMKKFKLDVQADATDDAVIKLEKKIIMMETIMKDLSVKLEKITEKQSDIVQNLINNDIEIIENKKMDDEEEDEEMFDEQPQSDIPEVNADNLEEMEQLSHDLMAKGNQLWAEASAEDYKQTNDEDDIFNDAPLRNESPKDGEETVSDEEIEADYQKYFAYRGGNEAVTV